jgi:hypothetical protein
MNKIASVFETGAQQVSDPHRHPYEMAEIAWAMFYGLVLWEKGDGEADQNKTHLEKILDHAFEIFERGITA